MRRALVWPTGTGGWFVSSSPCGFGISLSRSSCLNYLHRLGFAFKRPKKRLLKADEAKRESFVAEYAALMEEGVSKQRQDILL